MTQIVKFLQGRKTYIIAAALVVVAALSYFHVIPDADTIVAAAVAIAGIAVTLHAAIVRVIGDLKDELYKS